MNTVEKGDKFEDRVFNLFDDWIRNNKLGVNSENCKIYQKKGYYSKDRESNIIVDISVEVFFEGFDTPSMLFIIECKDYDSLIPVGKMEEFERKVQQITGLNTKGFFVTSNGFQQGALTLARNRKIATIRLMPKDQVEWYSNFMGADMMRKVPQLNPQEFNRALMNQNHKAIERSFYSADDGYIFGNLSSLLRNLLG